MLFSIATPTRNALPALKQCVGSVRAQHGVTHEHCIRDACSSDGTPSWLGSQPDLRWESKPDGGMYAAINDAWSHAHGDILSWLNADEQYLPGTLATVATAFCDHPEVDLVWGNAIVVDPSGHPVAWRREIPLRSFYVRYVTLYAFSCTMFFRRRLWDTGVLKLDDTFKVIADADLVMRLLACGTRTLHLPSDLSLFGYSGANLSITEARLKDDERARLRQSHKIVAHRPLRIIARALRAAEKGVRGCYVSTPLSYDYALDATPTHRHVTSQRTPSRFTLTPGKDEVQPHA